MDITLLRTFLILLTITLLSYETINLFYKIISFLLTKQTAVVKGHVPSPFVTDSRSIEDYEIITERNLFRSTLKVVKDNELDGGLPASEERFTDFDLKGTVACNSSFGYIFIEKRDSKKQRFYRLGDMIGSSKLIKITRNTAILRCGDRKITLKVKATAEDQPLSNARFRNLTLDRKTVNNNLGNLNALMKGAVVRPFIHKGVQEGLIVSNIVPNSLYEKMGLQNGDILIDINGKRINAASLMQAADILRYGSRIALNIKRKGREETINYVFE
jgi:general secretion pathway protein C